MGMISVIIPVLNEVSTLPFCIRSIRAYLAGSEIVVVDGGSTDGSVDCARDAGARVLKSPERGRGPQLNYGAREARGEVLVFLHADTVIAGPATAALCGFFSDSRHQIATFRFQLDIAHWILSWYCFCSRFDSVLTRFGDQGIAVRRSFFAVLEGFPPRAYFEDVEFLRKARNCIRIPQISVQVVTSARRFVKNGIARQYFFDALSMFRYVAGRNPEELSRRYQSLQRRSPDRAVIVFARRPVPGKVKTRLAAGIGVRSAAEIYRRIAEYVCAQVRTVGNTRRYLFSASREDLGAMRRWVGNKFFFAVQSGNDLGERMEDAARIVFAHGVKKVLIVGTDTPGLSVSLFQDAFRLLEEFDTVLGPSEDGGYYLLGMKTFSPQLFARINWSTSEVLAQTLRQARACGFSTAMLPRLRDIDRKEDWVQWQKDGCRFGCCA
ncbi:MAG: DUF2064 domain-containing protein [Candidatus Omnitrophica bacterium]|nr:DUF2064 domain-containing protein [Candidatus Omnitrophota bacterium]